MNTETKLKIFWRSNNETICLSILFMIFVVCSLFIAFNLEPGIIPDEPAHFTFSKHYSTTLGIPQDTYETYALGWYIQQNPFLYYWIMGRVINLTTLIQPSVTDLALLITLRVVNTFFALGTVIFCFFLSCEVIKKKCWRLLPVFILTNILMFVFLAGGVNYDNLANLFSMIALYFFVRSLKQKAFITTSLLWMIFTSLGTLVKYPLLPLALAMTVAWSVAVITHRKDLFPLKFNRNHILLIIILTLLFGANLAIYGINLIRYRALTPPCLQILTESECEISPYTIRYREMAVQPKLSIEESIRLGFPSPLRYVLIDWIWHILLRSFGVVGHQSYFPLHLISYYQVLFYWIIFLSLVNLIYYRQVGRIQLYLFGIMLFYSLTILLHNYNSELVYRFLQISLQGRYIFPIIGIILVLFTCVLIKVPSRIVRWITTIYTLGLITYGGTLTILYGIETIFSGWFF